MTKVRVEEGHDVVVLAGMMHASASGKQIEYKGKYFVEKSQGKVLVWRCHVSELYNANFVGRLWAYFSFVFSSLICGLFYVKQKPDVVLVTSPPLFVGITGLVISKLRRIPFVFEIRDLWPESARGLASIGRGSEGRPNLTSRRSHSNTGRSVSRQRPPTLISIVRPACHAPA